MRAILSSGAHRPLPALPILGLPLQVELREDLVGSCTVGDVVNILGLVKVLAAGDAPGERA